MLPSLLESTKWMSFINEKSQKAHHLLLRVASSRILWIVYDTEIFIIYGYSMLISGSELLDWRSLFLYGASTLEGFRPQSLVKSKE